MCLDLLCLSCVGKNKERNEVEDTSICLSRLPGFNQRKLYGQDYMALHALCRRKMELFEDPKFPPIDQSLYFSRTPPANIEWRRASELSTNPKFFVDGPSRMDIHQGELGNCCVKLY